MSLRNSHRALRTALLFASAPLLTIACDEDFESRTLLSDYRVLGIQTTPPEVEPDATLDVQVYEYQQGDKDVVHTWSLCLYSLGALTDYACDDAQEATQQLSSTESFSLDLGPDGVDLRGRLDTLGDRFEADGNRRSLTEGFDIWLKLQSGPDCNGCERIDSVKKLFIREAGDEADQETNTNPTVQSFTVEGERSAGSTLTLALEADTPQIYNDPLTGETREEEYLYTWYSTAGETDPGLTFGEEQQTEWTIPNDAKTGDTLELFVAVRDGRGGLSVEAQAVTVE